MRIIVLQGASSKGKTTTLNLVWDLLTESGMGRSTDRQVLGNPKQNDFSDIVMIGNRKIAFYSMGDSSPYVQSAVNKYIKEGCDMLICALSTDNTNVKADDALDKSNADRMDKTIVDGKDPAMHEAANGRDALKILSKII